MLEKRSLSLAGHRTSIALEPQFWAALTTIATSRQTSLLSIIRTVDETRPPDEKLASALRVFVLEKL